VRGQVSRLVADVLLPLVKVRVRRCNRMVASVAPLFPCYMFALLDFERESARLRYTRGLREIVRFGDVPAVVPDWIIGELKQRCAYGPLELPRRRLLPHESVRVAEGPLRDLEGIFEDYLSGSERVVLLLSLMGGARALLPGDMVVPAA